MLVNKPKTKKIDYSNLKPKRRKAATNARSNNRTCPNCLSSLRINRDGSWECSGNRLKFWEEQFIKYQSTPKDEREVFLKNFSNVDKFKEMNDEYRKTKEISCGYNSKLFYPDNNYSTQIPDPMVVGKIEKGLKRLLTEEELVGKKVLYSLNGQYLTEFKEGASIVEIPLLAFPEEV